MKKLFPLMGVVLGFFGPSNAQVEIPIQNHQNNTGQAQLLITAQSGKYQLRLSTALLLRACFVTMGVDGAMIITSPGAAYDNMSDYTITEGMLQTLVISMAMVMMIRLSIICLQMGQLTMHRL